MSHPAAPKISLLVVCSWFKGGSFLAEGTPSLVVEAWQMVTVEDYTVEKLPNANAYRIQAKAPPICPACGALLSGYDTRTRHVVDGSGQAFTFQLRRLRCPACRRLHLELPDFMRPHKHYSASVIQAVETGDDISCPADDSTIRRWRKNHPPVLPVHPAPELIP